MSPVELTANISKNNSTNLPTTISATFSPPSTVGFVVRSGPNFERKHHQYPFMICKPTHGIFNYFTKLVEQHTKILIPSKMCDRFKIKLQQTTHALGILAYNQRLLIDNSAEDDLFALLKRYTEQRQIVKQLENQLKCVTLKTKSQSQQIQDQRQRRLNSADRAAKLHKTIQQIYDIINYRGHHTAPIDQLHYIKKICEDRLRDDISSEDDDDDEDELDSRNCTINDEQNESILIHPRVVLPQSSTKKRLLNQLDEENDLQNKRLRYEDASQCITFECYTSLSSTDNSTRPFIVSTDIKMIDNSCNEQRTCLTISTDDTSSSSIESTTKLTTIGHRFISKKIFKPETCFVCFKRINFGSVSYRCSYCSQSCHANCKENAGSNCKTLSTNAMLPPYSPKTPTMKNTDRQRMFNSEPRKPSTIQRRLPFEGMMSQKTNPGNTIKYFPRI